MRGWESGDKVRSTGGRALRRTLQYAVSRHSDQGQQCALWGFKLEQRTPDVFIINKEEKQWIEALTLEGLHRVYTTPDATESLMDGFVPQWERVCVCVCEYA